MVVVLQNLTKQVSYNGHIARVLDANTSDGQVRVAVHGVFFGAAPKTLRVRPKHVRPLRETARPGAPRTPPRVRASSTRGDFPVDAVLNAAETEWWISEPG